MAGGNPEKYGETWLGRLSEFCFELREMAAMDVIFSVGSYPFLNCTLVVVCKYACTHIYKWIIAVCPTAQCENWRFEQRRYK